MSRSFSINITTPTAEFPYTKTRRIELVVGVYAADMSLTLLNAEGKFVNDLKAEGETLEQLGVKEGYTIRVEDTSGKTADPMAGDVKKYEINEERYRQREDTARNFLKKNVLLPHIAVGNRCIVQSKAKGDRAGRIAYVGEVHFKPDVMVGVVLDEPLGKHDGEVDGKRYFECTAPHGVFVDRHLVKPPAAAAAKTTPAQPAGDANGAQIDEM
ncbi:Tubulin-folding cofactor B [Aphelenchoides fujianensis]|nr:Tubulin-folding cofactor B [Aphelenchoides fujianensis]